MSKAASRALIVAFVCLGSVRAGADESQKGTPEEQKACTPDVFRLCSAFIPNEDRIVACLKQNKDKLSPGCKKVFS